jgi:excisionase family DNA binding protein
MQETYNPFSVIFTELSIMRDQINDIHELIHQPKQELPDDEVLLTIDQVCERLNISRVTAWKWANKKILKPVFVANKKRFRLSDIKSIIKNSESKN